ncbi:MAG: hypothetical protein SF051_15935 [Elusimicrobiota bacterium]|nr:hypothetical protein [Elusimicrobiota bacterium]
MRRLAALTALAAALLAAAARADAALLSAQGSAVLDSNGAPRATFSSNETIGFTQTVFNGVASVNRTFFQFEVLAPNGNTTFRHSGNSTPGSVGNASARIAGISVSGFYQGPGTYTMRATATLDGTNVQQTQTFTISSPNILLIYPPNGAVGLSDNPLTFQWFSSGAASYRISVGDNPSIYNPILVQNTGAGSSSFTYPQNPADDRQQLAAGQVYYWKVEGLDANGNVVAQSPVPFSFGVQTVANTRDIAVTGLDVSGPPDGAGAIPFVISVKNQGTTTETGIPLKFTIGGLPAPGTPIEMAALMPGDARSYNVSGTIPSDQAQGLAIACLTIFDDTVANNCKTLTVTRPTAGTGADTSVPGGVPLTADQIWEAIKQLLKERGIDLSEYDLVSLEGSLTRDELAALLDQLRQGQAQAIITGPPLSAAPPSSAPAAPAPLPYEAPSTASNAPAMPAPEETPQEDGATEWSGYAAPLSAKTMTLTVSDEGRWKKLWARLSDQPVPKVDFARYKVAAILVGKGVKVDRVSVESVQPAGKDLRVRYRLVTLSRLGRTNAPDLESLGTRFTPFLLKIVPRDVAAVRFEQSKEDTDD